MPRYGCINEIRHGLHEVIRLSGINMIIDDNDHPLIIKVASLQRARMQVYFIDNEDYFNRKATFLDEEGNLFPDNDERMIFFCRGVIETVRKLNWSPDIVHCHGWMASLLPVYIKKGCAEDPLFENSKIVYSLYNDRFEGSLDKNFSRKAIWEGVEPEDLTLAATPTYNNLTKLAVSWSDGIVKCEESIESELLKHVAKSEKPLLHHVEENFSDSYSGFYDEVLEKEEALVDE